MENRIVWCMLLPQTAYSPIFSPAQMKRSDTLIAKQEKMVAGTPGMEYEGMKLEADTNALDLKFLKIMTG